MPDRKEKLPLSVTHPELAAEADGWDPATLVAGSEKKRLWKCSLGHSYESDPYKRTKRNQGCPYCSGQQVLPGFNDLGYLNPALAAEAYEWDPTTVTVGSKKRVRWICTLGHQWVARVADRSQGTGCPICDGKVVLPGFNDLKTINPSLAAEAEGWDSELYTHKSGVKKIWKCSVGHQYEAAIRHRANGTGCPFCAGKKVLIGFNDLATTHPEIASSANGWNATTLTANSGLKREWKCTAGHIWSSRVIHRKEGGGCPSCAEYGFNPAKTAILYLLENKETNMLQIGISNSPKSRLSKHVSNGWRVMEISNPMIGSEARNWETLILFMLKAQGADLSNEKIAGKFDGYSEAWSKDTFEVKSIKELMRLTEEFESKPSPAN